MKTKCLEIRDRHTFLPVICIKPVAENEDQRYLLRRDGYSLQADDPIIIMIDAHCRGVNYDPYKWDRDTRTKPVAHKFIMEHWDELADGDVVDVEFILGETATKKQSERKGWPV